MILNKMVHCALVPRSEDLLTAEIALQRVRRANVRLNTLDCGQTPEVQSSAEDRFRGDSFLPVIDLQIDPIGFVHHLKAYGEVSSRF